jgi:CRISPR-associated protein Cmr4
MGSRSFEPIEVLGLYTETPLHCGAETGTGFVDMPVQRERHSGFPMIPGSTIKGVLRDDGEWGTDIDYFFGSDEKPKTEKTARIPGKPGAVSFGDAFLVAFPVRSSKFPFVWVTCPLILERTYRVLGEPWPPAALVLKEGQALINGAEDDVLLEELSVTAKKDDRAILAPLTRLLPTGDAFAYTRQCFSERLLAISDTDFGTIAETGTEIVTRIRIGASGTTNDGNLFNEEIVPRDALFASVLRELSDSSPRFPADKIPSVIRLGGHETIGRGVTWVSHVNMKKGEKP